MTYNQYYKSQMISPVVDSQIRSVIITLFPKYDKNQNGRLTANELTGFLNDAMDLFGFKLTVSQGQSNETLRLFDKNFDSELSKEQLYTALRYIIPKQSSGEHIFTPKPEEPISKVNYPDIQSKLQAQKQLGLIHKDKWANVNDPWANSKQQSKVTQINHNASQNYNSSQDPWANADHPVAEQHKTVSTAPKDPWQPRVPWSDQLENPTQAGVSEPLPSRYQPTVTTAVVSDISIKKTSEAEEIVYEVDSHQSGGYISLPSLKSPRDQVPLNIPPPSPEEVLEVQQPLIAGISPTPLNNMTSEEVLKKLEENSDQEDSQKKNIPAQLTSIDTSIVAPVKSKQVAAGQVNIQTETPLIAESPSIISDQATKPTAKTTNTAQTEVQADTNQQVVPLKQTITIQTQTIQTEQQAKIENPILKASPPREQKKNLGPSWVKPITVAQGWSRVQINTPQQLKLKNFIDEMYVKHDSDGSGCLDIKELSLAFNDILKFMGVNSELTPQEAIDLMKNIDKDQDDKIQRYQLYQCVKVLMHH